MKKIFFLITIFGLYISCSKDDNDTSKVVEVTINITNSLDYVYELGTYFENDEVEIVSQATHFEQSELKSNESGYTVYKYKSQAGYVGDDYVEIYSEKTIDTIKNKIEIKTIKLNFNILE